ncbi:MAG: hypothetical protein VX237_01065, partial [Chloroflexota bacterium]|nr:hypothetical protein [Chloroflexota bacterium]
MIHPDIKLSHSSANNFCAKQLWYKKVGKERFPVNFYLGAGTIVDAGYEAGLKNMMTGVEGFNIRKSMEESLDKIKDELDYDEFIKLSDSMDSHVQAVEGYMGWINYKPLETQHFFKITFEGHTRPTTGYMDIVAER